MDNEDILDLILQKLYTNILLDVLCKTSKTFNKFITLFLLNNNTFYLKIDNTIEFKLNKLLNNYDNKTIYLVSSKKFPSRIECNAILEEYYQFIHNENILQYFENISTYEEDIDVNSLISHKIKLNHNQNIKNNKIITNCNVFIQINKKKTNYIGKCGICNGCKYNKKCLNCICEKCVCKNCEKSIKHCICL